MSDVIKEYKTNENHIHEEIRSELNTLHVPKRTVLHQEESNFLTWRYLMSWTLAVAVTARYWQLDQSVFPDVG
jgi:hypothetical protein